jgi:hypothetical protein
LQLAIRDADKEFHGSLAYLFLPAMPVTIIAQLPGALKSPFGVNFDISP